jgi:uncharacterized protein (TIGR03067 family)
MERLQGVWVLDRTGQGEKRNFSERGKEPVLIIKGNKFTLSTNKLEANIKLDPSKTPKRMDLASLNSSNKGKSLRACKRPI